MTIEPCPALDGYLRRPQALDPSPTSVRRERGDHLVGDQVLVCPMHARIPRYLHVHTSVHEELFSSLKVLAFSQNGLCVTLGLAAATSQAWRTMSPRL